MCLPSLSVVRSRYGSCLQKKKRSLDSPVYLLTGRSSTLHRCYFQIYSKSLLLTYELVLYVIVACYWISKVRTNTFFVNIWSRLKLVVFFVSQDINTWSNVYTVVVLYRDFPNHKKIRVWSCWKVLAKPIFDKKAGMGMSRAYVCLISSASCSVR